MQTKVPQPSKKSPQRNFRPWPENQLSFEFAEKQKLNVSELLNQIVAKHFKRHLAATMQANQRAFESQFGARPSSRKTSTHKLTKSR